MQKINLQCSNIVYTFAQTNTNNMINMTYQWRELGIDLDVTCDIYDDSFAHEFGTQRSMGLDIKKVEYNGIDITAFVEELDMMGDITEVLTEEYNDL